MWSFDSKNFGEDGGRQTKKSLGVCFVTTFAIGHLKIFQGLFPNTSRALEQCIGSFLGNVFLLSQTSTCMQLQGQVDGWSGRKKKIYPEFFQEHVPTKYEQVKILGRTIGKNNKLFYISFFLDKGKICAGWIDNC